MLTFADIVSPEVGIQAERFCQQFTVAKPFKHVCIDGFLTREAADQALADFPAFKDENALNEFGKVGGKAVETKLGSVSPFYGELYDCLRSPQFLALMSEITGIPDLLPDPKLFGGGTHENRDGQELDPHVDFNRMEDLSAYRRLNLLIYLNHNWKAEWGGSIELHSDPRSPDNQITAFAPIFNRAVVFETNEISWHGFPRIRLPADRKHLSRKSLSIYLYTKDRPRDEIVAPHATFYVQRPLDDHFTAGHVLSEEDVAELHGAVAKRDSWIEHYQKRELELNAQLTNGRRFLNEVLANVWAPITGYGLQKGKVTGMYHDRWASPELKLTIEPLRPVTRVTLRGWVPDHLPEGGELRFSAADERVATPLKPGAFAITVELPKAVQEPIPIFVEATQWVRPEGPAGRTLSYVVRNIELWHAG
jgi:2OG-Fe(II) oxygenase superfamily